jgi:hypothetical protein
LVALPKRSKVPSASGSVFEGFSNELMSCALPLLVVLLFPCARELVVVVVVVVVFVDKFTFAVVVVFTFSTSFRNARIAVAIGASPFGCLSVLVHFPLARSQIRIVPSSDVDTKHKPSLVQC